MFAGDPEHARQLMELYKEELALHPARLRDVEERLWRPMAKFQKRISKRKHIQTAGVQLLLAGFIENEPVIFEIYPEQMGRPGHFGVIGSGAAAASANAGMEKGNE